MSWYEEVLACPKCKGSLKPAQNDFRCYSCQLQTVTRDGVICFEVPREDPSISWYESIDGTHFHERSAVPFTMSSLDTPVYRAYLEASKPASLDSVIVDVGCGDGRNTRPWLDWGYKRVIAIDPIHLSLSRFRKRVLEKSPELAGSLLLIQADAREVPLKAAHADFVFAIESLYYLNESYSQGLAECARIVRRDGRVMVSERSWEGAILTALLYGGIGEMLKLKCSRQLSEGPEGNRVSTRSFTEDEILREFSSCGLQILEKRGISILPLIIGYLRSQGKVQEGPEAAGEVAEFMKLLGRDGTAKRTHVLVARKG